MITFSSPLICFRKGLTVKLNSTATTKLLKTHIRSISKTPELVKKGSQNIKNKAELITSRIRSHLPKNVIKRENIYNLPNLLTMSRILMTPMIGHQILSLNFFSASVLLVIAGATDAIDGYLARKWKQKTFLGSVLDPAADKLLMTVLAITLMKSGSLPIWIGGLILGRDIGMIIAGTYYRYISLPPPKTIKRYFDMSLPSVEVNPPLISKANTFFQLLLMAMSLFGSVFGFLDSIPMDILRYIVGITTVWSGVHYMVVPNAFRLLNQK